MRRTRRERKAVEFANAAPGMIGLETALGAGTGGGRRRGRLELMTLIAALSTRPARAHRRVANPGRAVSRLTWWSSTRARRWRVEAETLASRSANTPLLGMELPGVVRLTVAGGRVTYAHDLAPLS